MLRYFAKSEQEIFISRTVMACVLKNVSFRVAIIHFQFFTPFLDYCSIYVMHRRGQNIFTKISYCFYEIKSIQQYVHNKHKFMKMYIMYLLINFQSLHLKYINTTLTYFVSAYFVKIYHLTCKSTGYYAHSNQIVSYKKVVFL